MDKSARHTGPARLLEEAAKTFLDKTPDLKWIIDEIPMGVMVLDAREAGFPILSVNQAFADFAKCPKEDIASRSLNGLKSLPFSQSLMAHAKIALSSRRPVDFDAPVQNNDGYRHYSGTVTPRMDGDGMVYQILTVLADKSADKETERRLLFHAHHDPLTQLPNRILFQEELERALETRADNPNRHCGILIINVDRFQMINETLGHLAGDEFLITLATRLNNTIATETTLARLSGDEFAVLVEDLKDPRDLQNLADQIHQIMERPYFLGKSEFIASACIGLATTHCSSPCPEELMRDADFAMHRAKSKGRAQTEAHQRTKQKQIRSQFLLEIELRQAVQRNQLLLHYQPIMDIKTGSLVGAEALARWQHPVHGLVPPDEFIPIAEESGIIVDLGRWALRETAATLSRWKKKGLIDPDFYISVNISNTQFHQTNVANDAERALKENGLDARSLTLELTETAIMEHPEEAMKALREVKKLGLAIALDDFGTGYSSLSALHRYPLDIVKIDRSFVAELNPDDGNSHIIEVVAHLGESLGLKIIAEGIETETQLELLHKLGCQMGQGFYYSRPVEAEAFEKRFFN